MVSHRASHRVATVTDGESSSRPTSPDRPTSPGLSRGASPAKELTTGLPAGPPAGLPSAEAGDPVDAGPQVGVDVRQLRHSFQRRPTSGTASPARWWTSLAPSTGSCWQRQTNLWYVDLPPSFPVRYATTAVHRRARLYLVINNITVCAALGAIRMRHFVIFSTETFMWGIKYERSPLYTETP